MADVNDLIDNLNEFQNTKFKEAMDVSNDLQTKQLEALNQINESIKGLKENGGLGGGGGGNGGSSGGFGGIFDNLLRSFFGDGTGSGGGLGGGIFRGLSGALSSLRQGLARSVPGLIFKAFMGIGGLVVKGVMWNPFISVAKTVAKGFTNLVSKGVDLVKQGVSYAFNKMKEIPGALWNYGKAAVSRAIDTATNLAKSVASGLKNIVSTMVNTVVSGTKRLASMAMDTFKELVLQPMLEGADAYIETTNKIRKEVGWQKGEYEQFSNDMANMIGKLGNKVGANEVLQKAHEVVQLGIRDEEAVSAYTETLMKMQLALDIDASGMKNLLELTRRLGAQGSKAIEKLGKSIRALDDANLVKALGNKDLMAFADKLSDVFGGNSEPDSEEFLKQEQWAMAGVERLSQIDKGLGEGFADFISKIGNARADQLGDLSAEYGINAKAIRDMIDNQDIEGVMRAFTAKTKDYVDSGLWDVTDQAMSGFAKLMSRGTAARLARNGKLNDVNGIMVDTGAMVEAMQSGADTTNEKGQDNLDQAISGLNVGLLKEMQNANSALGIHYGELLRDTGVNGKDVSWSVNKLIEIATIFNQY